MTRGAGRDHALDQEAQQRRIPSWHRERPGEHIRNLLMTRRRKDERRYLADRIKSGPQYG